MPAIFVWLWSTGFIGAKYGLPYAEPFTLLLYRMLSTLVVLGVIAWWLKSEWPTLDGVAHTAITGLLVHGLYLGGVFYAIEDGMPAGVVSIIVGLQPLATAAVAVVVLREAITIRQWSGLVLGLIGVSLVILEKMGDTSQATGFPVWALLWALIALGGISFGTVYQKRYCQNVDLVPGAFIQYCAASVLFALGAFALESREVSWNMQLILATGWLVLGLSVGAILLLMQLIRRGAASNVASLFYLVPPVTALQAYILFDERLGVLALCGGLLSVLGVALVIIKRDR
ncbi:DMT family transporter [Marinobacter sp. AL4B]|uniref:DMT family transporter n=1 Tax=Marinobacter sp. AL4B TaxID=2871173 RepID=UPI001CAA48D5|nr:DMT family transporter [Marinobacter sp. AL4B]MBZ0333470.1 DMT family transporter [Marinobacter sp. AL4B]